MREQARVPSTTLATTVQLALWGLVVVYSLVHFFVSGAGGVAATPESRCGGEFEDAFPGPFVARYNPQLEHQFNTLEANRLGLWNYGPLHHVATLPLTILPSRAVICPVWMATNGVFLLIAGVFCFRVLRPARITLPYVASFIALWLNFTPLLATFRTGSIELLELTLISAALVIAARGVLRPRQQLLVGFLLGCAAMLKFLPVVFAPYFLVKARWHAFATLLAVVAVVAVAAQLLFDWSKNMTMEQFDPLGGFRLYFQSQAISAIVMRPFATFPSGLTGTVFAELSDSVQPLAVSLARLVTVGIAIGFAALFWLRRHSTHPALEFALILAFMVLIPQRNAGSYLVFLVIPLSVLLTMVFAGPSGQRVTAGSGLAIIYAMTGSFVVPSSVIQSALGLPEHGVILVTHNLSLPGLANLVMLLWLALVYWRTGAQPAAASQNLLGATAL